MISSFMIGLLIGLFCGMASGVLVMALMTVASDKEAQE